MQLVCYVAAAYCKHTAAKHTMCFCVLMQWTGTQNKSQTDQSYFLLQPAAAVSKVQGATLAGSNEEVRNWFLTTRLLPGDGYVWYSKFKCFLPPNNEFMNDEREFC